MSYILAGSGLLTMYLAPRNPRLAWTFALTIQPVWLWYSITTEQWGFLASTLVYSGLYAANLRRELR